MTAAQWEHPDAVEEFDAAAHWYESQRPGTGLKLLDRAREARREIADWPDAARLFARTDDGAVIRSKDIRGFPYRILYALLPDAIVIVAYAHEHRKPGYWARRIASSA
ncbi:hypothetical protein BMH32_13460 [Leucobacter sp. OLJS4]|uniref:plasmid stabilization protein n=1 Tax=unclassified Leucobacter TaxID=2621730 RepID=UPI000C18E5FB|nr:MULTISPECIES: plasmid stabilization protein [unclassified Leucobacter]PIJ47406.1 hypothetical protein BMH30_07155 [Leucobacter sp. OLES1]PII84773.1 hypothetical protein BMH25_03195 [Leucobacter sp. OLCALW19]PII87801.1 hypothetical protein BMH26_08670 [Leucobacter sp. OLTLW20]PII93889.1 hypothetical protein BMH27_02945 [Leucobacter sp. OLAS13]PII98442.1 hypothetical protein BMH29_07790 [Leucobacter sp. OLDS2]